MRIALFVHCFLPEHFYGTETYTLNLAQHLIALGHEPIVVTAIFPGEPTRGKEITEYIYQNVPVICLDKNYYPHKRVKDTFYQPELKVVYERVLDFIKPDLVHVTHLINHTAVLLEVLAERKILSVATLTDFFGFCFNNKLENAAGNLCAGPNKPRSNCLACYGKAASINRTDNYFLSLFNSPRLAQPLASAAVFANQLPILKSTVLGGVIEDLQARPDILCNLYSQYSACITPTNFLRSAYERNGFLNSMHPIWFGTDIDRTPKQKRNSNHPLRFGFIGQIAPHKGTDLLIEAFNRLPSSSATLQIFGSKDQAPQFFSALQQMAGTNVHFRGTFPQQDMAQVLAEIDVLVIPSRWYENSPLVLLDALATGTPTVVSNVEGLTEFVQDGVNGYSFERGSVDSLETVLRQLLEKPEQLSSMIKNTSFNRTIRDMAIDTILVYKSILSTQF